VRYSRLLLTLLAAIVLIVTASAATTYEKTTSPQESVDTHSEEGVASGDTASEVASTTKSERSWGLAVVRVGVAVGKAVARAVAIVAVVVVKTVVHMFVPGP